MTNFVELTAFHDTAGPCVELRISFSCDGFSGQGAAYFDARSLESAVGRLQVFPILPLEPVLVEGGYLGDGGLGVLREKHVSLSFSAGDLSPLEVRVGVGVPWHHKAGMRHWAEATFLIDYEQLRAFSEALSALARGERSSVVIDLHAFG